MTASKPLTNSQHQDLDTLAAHKNGSKPKQTYQEFQWQLINAENGYWEADKVMEYFSVNGFQHLDEMREQGRLLGVWWEDRYLYPAWQFIGNGKVLTGLSQVLRALNPFSGWEKLSYILSPNHYLDDQHSPLEELQRGNIEDVVLAATE
jgi:hypothetical protein